MKETKSIITRESCAKKLIKKQLVVFIPFLFGVLILALSTVGIVAAHIDDPSILSAFAIVLVLIIDAYFFFHMTRCCFLPLWQLLAGRYCFIKDTLIVINEEYCSPPREYRSRYNTGVLPVFYFENSGKYVPRWHGEDNLYTAVSVGDGFYLFVLGTRAPNIQKIYPCRDYDCRN